MCIKLMDSSSYEAARAEIEDLLKPEVQGDRNRAQYPEGRVQLHLCSLEGQGLRRPGYEHPDGEPDPDEAGFNTQLLAAVYLFKGENTVYWIYSLDHTILSCLAETSRCPLTKWAFEDRS